MAKKLSEIEEIVKRSNISFFEFLKSEIDSSLLNLLLKINNYTSVYIFSGIIRNFFLNIKEVRDIDVILKDKIDIYDFFKNYKIKKNSFGGYKIYINENKLDLWFVEDSWAFKHQKTINFQLEKYFPATAFFNFSAISYSIGEKEFNYSNDFLRFLRDKKIDLVYKPNSNYTLCIVNSIYYAEKFKLNLSDRLLDHLRYLNKIYNDYENTQLHHFGKIIYTSEQIEKKLNYIFKDRYKKHNQICSE